MTTEAGVADETIEKAPCLMPDCDRPEEAGGLCAAHRYRKKKGLPLSAPIRGPMSSLERVTLALEALQAAMRNHDEERERRRKLSEGVQAVLSAFIEYQETDAEAEADRKHHAAIARLRAACKAWADRDARLNRRRSRRLPRWAER